MSKEKSDTKVSDEISLADKKGVLLSLKTLSVPGAGGNYNICCCCGTTDPTTTSYKSWLQLGYAKYKKTLHWVFSKDGKPADLKREKTLVIRDVSGATLTLGWGDNLI